MFLAAKFPSIQPRRHLYIFLFYDRPFLHVCNLVENLFSTLILGSVFNDYVVFYRDWQTGLQNSGFKSGLKLGFKLGCLKLGLKR